MSNSLAISENNLTLSASETLVNVLIVSASTQATATAWGGITGTLSAQTDLQAAIDAKQATLVSATNIKTINSISLLGSGDIAITVSPEFLNTVFRVVDSVSGYKGIIDTTAFTDDRTVTYANFNFNFNDYFLSTGGLKTLANTTTNNVALNVYWGSFQIMKVGASAVGAALINLTSIGTIGFSNNSLNLTTIDTIMSRKSLGVMGFNGTISTAAPKSGTLASPPTGLVIGEYWSDTTDSATHPIVRRSTVTT